MEEIEQSYIKLTDFFGALAKHRKRGQHLLSEIERAKRCFSLQLRDVTVVEDVRNSFFFFDMNDFLKKKRLEMQILVFACILV